MNNDYVKVKKLCKFCSVEIPNKKKNNIFCSQSCAGKYNNVKFKKTKYCKYCNIQCKRLFCSVKCKKQYDNDNTISLWKMGKISGLKENGQVSITIRNYLFKKYDNKCSECGWNKINEYSGKCPLEVEHIDGNYKNNVEENLKLLCPNCHSLTSTYKALNKGFGRHLRMKRYNDGKSY